MRLLNVNSLDFTVFHSARPKYAIASHRWSLGSEATFKDVHKKRNMGSAGYRKVLGFAEYVKKMVPGVDWVWIDTCCIVQDSSEEISEAVNSMFRWYRAAEICIAYLFDVKTAEDLSELRRSQWFSRGWTLQELLAPNEVVFVTRSWQVIGHKGSIGQSGTSIGPSLEKTISAVTGIPEAVLGNYDYSKALSAEKKLEWMVDRETTREEDESYCLLGMFDVFMPIIYGEGRERARKRLVAEIAKGRIVPVEMEADYVVLPKPPRSLHDAASSGNLEFITQLLETTPSAMAQLWKWDAGGSLPLHRAVQNGHALTCKLLIASMNKQTWEPIDLLDINGKSPIMHILAMDAGSDDVLREFLTDEGLCFAVPTILILRRAVLIRVLEIGGSEAVQKAIVVMRRVLPPDQFCDALKRALPILVALPNSDALVVTLAAESVRLDKEQRERLSLPLARIADNTYDWAIAERVKRLILLHKAGVLGVLIGSDGVNFVGKAIATGDLTTLTALHAVDSQLFSRPIGWWTRHHLAKMPALGPWQPLRFAALIGDLATVQEMAQLSEHDDASPPHLRAIHLAALAATDGLSHTDTWQFLRGFVPEDQEQRECEFCTVDLQVRFDSDWGCIMFPHQHEAVIEDIRTPETGTYMWDGGFVRRHLQKRSSNAAFNIRVRLKCVAAGLPITSNDVVHVDFMHGWNDLQGEGGKGRVVVSLSSLQSEVYFREVTQHQFQRLQGSTELISGTDWTESHHSLRSWHLHCVRP